MIGNDAPGLEILDGVRASAVKFEDHRVPRQHTDDAHERARNQQIADDTQLRGGPHLRGDYQCCHAHDHEWDPLDEHRS